ncbi:Scoloptoxin SSD976 [Clonorchis sinensis]|uniref:Scoloptoxin SSD976 n=1 Tax=Clonorchis sinensis TaxID=79923 RepID=A0A419QCI2_CLOSI|nr:Scoloptoxin SSD976 [Clonorchis sinensis]
MENSIDENYSRSTLKGKLVSVSTEFRTIWFQIEHDVDGNPQDCLYLINLKKGKIGSGLSKSFHNVIRGELSKTFLVQRAIWLKWLEREFSDRKVRSSNPTSASRLPLSRLGQPGSISALVLPSGCMASRQRKGGTAERFLCESIKTPSFTFVVWSMISKDMLRIFAIANFLTLLFCITSSLGKKEQLLTEQQFLDYHNQYRKMLLDGSLKNQPRAANMPSLISNKRLTRDARNWAKKCVFKHDASSKDGENLAASSNVADNPVAIWFEEHNSYTFGKLISANVPKTGHYTQLVWANTTQLGCHQHFCNSLEDEKGSKLGSMYFSRKLSGSRTVSKDVTTLFTCLIATPPEKSMRAEILPGFPRLDRGSGEAEMGFEPRTFRSVNSCSHR